MKNLMKSVSIENPAKFVWEVGNINSNDDLDNKINTVDYNNVSDLEDKYRATNILQNDPDIDEDFINSIEEETKPEFKSKIDKAIFENNSDYKVALGIEKALFWLKQGKESHVTVNRIDYTLKYSKDDTIDVYIGGAKDENKGATYTLSNMDLSNMEEGVTIKEYFPHLMNNYDDGLLDYEKEGHKRDIMDIISKMERNIN